MDMEMMKLTLGINVMSFFKIPLLAFLTPKIVSIRDGKAVCKIGLGWRSQNHLGVMYFGALAMGAELSVAVTAVSEIQKSGERIDFIFKDFKCNFLKRADDDVTFTCEQANEVADLIARSLKTADRLQGTYKGYATVPSQSEPVMEYEVTLSVKHRPRKS